MSTPDGTLNPSKSTKNPKPITPSSEFATEGSTYTPSTPSTVSFTSELTTASSSGNLSHKDYTPVQSSRSFSDDVIRFLNSKYLFYYLMYSVKML